MSEDLLTIIESSILIGIGATITMDIWALFLQRFLSITPLNYALVGRWLVYMSEGLVYHENINTAKPIKGELIIGWVAHYLTGIIFAAVLIMITGSNWLYEPSIISAISFGLLTVGFPFLIMQPCMGLGIAATKTSKPNLARSRSLLTHFIFQLIQKV